MSDLLRGHHGRGVGWSVPIGGWPWLVFVLALAVRLWGIDWQLPAALYFDELKYVTWAGTTADGRRPQSTDFRNPSLFRHLLAAEYRITNSLAPIEDQRDRAVFRLALARVTSAVLGAGAVALTAMAAATLFTPWAGVVAGLVLGLSLLHVHISHYAVNDAPASLFLAATLLFAARGLFAPTGWLFFLAGFAGGLAAAAKYNFGIILILPLAAACVLRVSGRIGTGRVVALLALTLLGGSLGLVSAMPEILLTPGAVLDGMAEQASLGQRRSDGQSDSPIAVLYAEALLRGLGAPAVAVAAIGAAWLVRVTPWHALAVLLCPIVYFVVMLRSELFAARFALPLVLFMALLAAAGTVCLAGWWRTRRGRAAAGALIVVLMLVPAIQDVIHHDILAASQDTRLQAQAWLRDQARGTRVLAQAYSLPVVWEGSEPPPGYRVQRFRFLPEPAALGRLVCSGTRYVLLANFNYERELRRLPEESPPTAYDRLREYGALVDVFSPYRDGQRAPQHPDDTGIPVWHLRAYARPGPHIEVYWLPDDGRALCQAVRAA